MTSTQNCSPNHNFRAKAAFDLEMTEEEKQPQSDNESVEPAVENSLNAKKLREYNEMMDRRGVVSF